MDNDDLETMDIAMILDYIDEYLTSKNPEAAKSEKVIEFAEEIPWL